MVFDTRNGRPDDLKPLLKIMEECFPPEIRADELDYKIRLEKLPEHMIIGLVDNKPAGYTSSMILKNRPTVEEWEHMTSWDRVDSAAEYHDPHGSCFYLGAIAVKVQYRWNHFGRRLFLETAKLAKEKGHDHMYFITTPQMSSYFKKIGARMIDEEFRPFYGVPHAWHAFDTSKINIA